MYDTRRFALVGRSIWELSVVLTPTGDLGINAPELNQRRRPHLKPTNNSYRTDETYIKG